MASCCRDVGVLMRYFGSGQLSGEQWKTLLRGHGAELHGQLSPITDLLESNFPEREISAHVKR